MKCQYRRSPRHRKALVTALALLSASGTVACGSDDSTEQASLGLGESDGEESEQTDGAGGEGMSSGPAETSPAVLVGVFVRNPDGRNIYVGAVPEVPTGELDWSDFLEFGDVDVSTYGGYVFVWEREPATMTRLTVAEDLQLTAGPTLSFLNQGVSGGASTVYISATRAYTLSPALDLVVIWDPQAMLITGTLEMTPPERAEGLNTFAGQGYVAGGAVIWPLMSTNWDGEGYHPAAAVAIASATTESPVRIVEDARCVGSDGAHVDTNGDLYLRAGGYWGSAAAYGDRAAETRTCVLRIKADAATFDPDFLVDISELTGSYVNFPWFHVEGSQYLAQVWASEVAFPDDIDEFWDGAGLSPLLVDIDSGESVPYPDVANRTMVSSSEFKLDGVSYYQLSETGTAVGGSTDVVELRPDGITTRFTLPELWAFARIR